jgi:hypothetical protein
VIGDRLGMSFEIVPHLFGATNRFPTGQRGGYAIWRNDGRVKVANALRYGEVLQWQLRASSLRWRRS